MTDKNRWGVVFSSLSGSHRAQKRWRHIRQYMEFRGVAYDFVQSEGFGSVERLTRMLCENGYRTIVIVGGDGALNDAVNGILSVVDRLPDDFAFGVLPNGTGNDFASFWGIGYDNYKKSVDNIISRRTRKVDVGVCYLCNESVCIRRSFLNCVNIGFGARLVGLTGKWMRLMGGKRWSLLPVFLSQIFERKSFKVRLKADTETFEQEVMSICVGNAHGYGQTPNAVPYNGMLDMSIITRPLWWQLFEGFWLLGKGQFLNYRNVHPYRVEQVEFFDLGHASVSLDGSLISDTHISTLKLTVEQEKLQFIVGND